MNNLNIKTHMPFILNNNITFCCFGFKELMFEYNYFWKIGYIDFTKEQKFFLINTGLPNESINCSPFITYKNNEYILSFTSCDNAISKFNMHIFKGKNIDSLQEIEIVNNIKYGFKEYDSYYYMLGNYFYINSNQILTFNKDAIVLKLNKCRFGILITIDHIKYGLFELLLNKNNQIKIIKIKNLNINPYKCHLYNDILAYAKKGDTFEDREIDFTHDFYFENLPEELAKDIEIVNDWNAYL